MTSTQSAKQEKPVVGLLLSAREREVMQLVAEGKGNREIAEALFISENTVKGHLRSVIDKLNGNNGVEAARHVLLNDLLEEGLPQDERELTGHYTREVATCEETLTRDFGEVGAVDGLPLKTTGQAKLREIRIAIIGLGQVGLPTALHFAKAGASVIGVDLDERKVNSIKQGDCPLKGKPIDDLFSQVRRNGNFQVTSETTKAIKDSDVYILCLPTPLGRDKLPDFSAVVAASKVVGKGLKKGDLVILESSVYPGVTSKIVRPTLEEQSGLRAGEDFGLAYAFERIDPGNVDHGIDSTPKIIGAVDEESADAAAAIYSLIVKAPVIKVRDTDTAELVKLVENVYRDINIAFANEIAILCEKLGIDVIEVLDAASTKWSFNPHIPGAGVGGVCIPVNPYYLLECARQVGLDLKLVKQARVINESMPHHMIELVKEALGKVRKRVQESRICILGLAYKANVDDSRGSPAEEIANELEQLGAEVVCHDPFVTPNGQGMKFERSFEEAVKGSDCIVITSDHSCFKSLDLQTMVRLAHTPLAVVDGRHVIIPREAEASGITYVGLGRNQESNLNIWNSRLKANGR